MKKENKNYKEFDSLTLYVKGTLSEKLIKYYNLLGWKLVDESENMRYEDIVDLTFSRPHNIKNKDELHLLQVYLEERLNYHGKCTKFKHAHSTSLGLFLGIVGLAFLVVGLLLILNVLQFFGLTIAIVFTSLGVVMLLSGGIVLPKIIKEEQSKYISISEKIEKEIKKICETASKLTGGENGK